jgi:hypothetical protein
MNAIVFVLLLASSDGGINTDLKFSDFQSCMITATVINNEALRYNSGNNNPRGFRYVRAMCVKASNLVQLK